ncbi:phage baseplate assembly protein V [Methylotetracoccus oryzae]|uniref:phage baseplate assembly protein V n=1 Tax=Methylotetracoccus oryzae TaxID=1919059 RepID=UPI00111B5D2E|nr:phage baseplate assembly protein V [Methylotetracoccus oryzae]
MPNAARLERPSNWLHAAYLARVVSLDDPERLNRIQVRLIGFDDCTNQDAPLWARVVCPFAGKDRGAFLIPDLDDEVLVVFQNGDPSYPLVVGGLWNGASAAPAEIAGGQNRYKVIRSKNGVTMTLDDQQGQERFILETPAGQKITLKDGPGSIAIEDANGNSVKLETAGITINAAANVKVTAAKVDVSAGMVNVDTAIAKFSGIVKCETLISTAVISSSYTPGAGNIW